MIMSAVPVSLTPKWYTVAHVAELLGYGESKVRMLIISVICARSRTVVPAGCCPSGWDEYVALRASQAADDGWSYVKGSCHATSPLYSALV
jgi:hypothetical protein